MVNRVRKLTLKSRGQHPKSARFDRVQLEALIEEATVDCYNDEEAATGLFTMIDENLEVPFNATILGVAVCVERIDMNDAGEIVAICRRNHHRQTIHDPRSAPTFATTGRIRVDRCVSPLGSWAVTPFPR